MRSCELVVLCFAHSFRVVVLCVSWLIRFNILSAVIAELVVYCVPLDVRLVTANVQ